MSSSINPYVEWLGLPKGTEAPNHFELLGLPFEESDARVIAKAADRAMTRVRSCKPGKDAARWAQLLDELNAARQCLVDPVTRDRYRQTFGTGAPTGRASAPRPPVSSAPPSPSISAAARSSAEAAKMPSFPRASSLTGSAAARPAAAAHSAAAHSAAAHSAAAHSAAAHSAAAKPNGAISPPSAASQNAAMAPFRPPSGGAAPSLPPSAGSVTLPPPATAPWMPPAVSGMAPQQADPMAPFSASRAVPTPFGTVPGTGLPAHLPVARVVQPAPVVATPATEVELRRRRSPAGAAGRGTRVPGVVLTIGFLVVLVAGLLFAINQLIRRPDGGSAIAQNSAMATPTTPTGQARSPEAKPDSGSSSPVSNDPAFELPEPGGGTVWKDRSTDIGASNHDRPGMPDGMGSPANARPNNSKSDGRAAKDSASPETKPAEVKPQNVNSRTPVPSNEPEKPTTAGSPLTTPPSPAPLPESLPAPTPEELAALSSTLKEVRDAITRQRFDLADTKLKKAEGLAKLPDHLKVVERTRELAHYAREFRKGLDEAIKQLQPADNIAVGTSTFVGVVNTSADRITLRVAGMNKTYAIQNLPWALALAIADTWLDQNEPSTFAAKGAYLMTLPKADDHARTKARELWKAAAEGGIETADMEQAVADSYQFTAET